MAMKDDDARMSREEFEEKLLAQMPIERRLKGLTPEQRLEGLTPEQLAQLLTSDEVLSALPPEVRELLAKKPPH